MQIEVLNVTPVTLENKGKNSWNQFVVKFNTNKGEQERTFRSFEPIYEAAKALRVGDKADVSIVKDGKYWNWTKIDLAEKKQEVTNAETKSTKTSTWETQEERLAKQRYIVRQSSITNAIALMVPQGKTTAVEVLKTAALFESFVFGDTVVAANEKKAAIKKAVEAAGQEDIPF